jgi:hypothetical protein
MNNIGAVLWDWRFVIAVVVAVAVYAIAEWNNFKTLAFQAMLRAKSKAKDAVLQSGKEQEDWVCEHLYFILSARVKVFIRDPEALRPVVHWLYQKAKDLLDDGKFNNSAVG